MAARLSNLNAASQIHPTPTNLRKDLRPCRRPLRVSMAADKNGDVNPTPLQVSRRASMGIAMAALLQQLGTGSSHAEGENNGLWLTDPLIPVPTVTNAIANKETGTRTFLRKGIYMAKLGPEMWAYRIKHYAFDLLAMGDLVGQDAWNYLRKYLCLKSTVMYYDFDKLISAAGEEEKPPLTDLANRLFDSVEKLEAAVKKKSDPMTRSCYAEMETILKEVMTRMA